MTDVPVKSHSFSRIIQVSLIFDGSTSHVGAGRLEKTLSVVSQTIVNLRWHSYKVVPQTWNLKSFPRELWFQGYNAMLAEFVKTDKVVNRMETVVTLSPFPSQVAQITRDRAGNFFEGYEVRRGSQGKEAGHKCPPSPQGAVSPPSSPLQGGGSHLNRLRPGDRRQKPPPKCRFHPKSVVSVVFWGKHSSSSKASEGSQVFFAIFSIRAKQRVGRITYFQSEQCLGLLQKCYIWLALASLLWNLILREAIL